MGNTSYIIGDNSPWLFKLNEHFDVTAAWPVYTLENAVQGVIPKPVKPDFEAMTLIGGVFYIFGSGSISPQRELLIKLNPDEPQNCTRHVLTDFYTQLKRFCQLADDELNIEAAVSTTDFIYLFNRGKNCLIRFSITEFNQFLINSNNTVELCKFDVELPTAGVTAKVGFSGATFVPQLQKILFTASAEDTKNWIDDGEILGSYLGLINLKTHQLEAYIPISENKTQLPLKVESVAVKSFSNGKAQLFFVCDQDGEASELIGAELVF